MAIPVTSKRGNQTTEQGDVYVGRPTVWGNPYTMPEDGTRDEVITLYREWIAEHPELVEQLRERRPRRLVCWCAPQACHADVLAELLERTDQ